MISAFYPMLGFLRQIHYYLIKIWTVQSVKISKKCSTSGRTILVLYKYVIFLRENIFFFAKTCHFTIFFSISVFWYSRRRSNGTVWGLSFNVLNNPNNLKCDLKTSWQWRGSASKSAASTTNNPWWKSRPVQNDLRTNGSGWNSDQFWPWWPFWNLWRLI